MSQDEDKVHAINFDVDLTLPIHLQPLNYVSSAHYDVGRLFVQDSGLELKVDYDNLNFMMIMGRYRNY